MESVLTVRLDGTMKECGTEVMRKYGYSPSQAVRKLFDYAVKHDALPFESAENADKEHVRKRIAAFDSLRARRPSGLSDEELRDERLRSRYGLDAR